MSDTYALVTGSSGGLGAEIASCLTRLHARNVIVSGRSEQRLRPVVERLAKENPAIKAIAIPADLSEMDGASRLFAGIAERGLVVDELVNNAGASAPGSALDLDPGVVRSEIVLDYISGVTLTMLFLHHLREHGAQNGRVIQILSMAARFNAMPNFSHYNSAKKAFDAYTKGVEYETRRAGIAVQFHRVYPGAISGTKIATSGITEKNKGIALSAAQVADAIVRESRQGKRVIIPGFVNKLAYIAAPIVPQFITDRAFYKTYGKD